MTLTREEAAAILNPRNHYDSATLAGNEFGEALRLVENAERELEAKIQYHVEMYRIYNAIGDKVAALTQMSNFAITSACLEILQGTAKPWWKLTPYRKRQAILFRSFGRVS